MPRPALGLALALGLAALPLAAEEMSDADRAALHAEIRAYLLDNPEVLVEAMEVLAQRRDQAMIEGNADMLFNAATDWVGGNPNGDITLVEFMDYRCGFCRKAHDGVKALIAQDGNIRLIVKEFPILGDASLISSQFAIAVLQLHGPDAYSAAHDALITLRGEPTPEVLTRLATDLKLDPQPILDRMNSDPVLAVIQTNHALAEAMEINGTPAFVTPAAILRSYAPLADLQAFVAQSRTGG